jgi:hypothetical protein
MPRAEVAADGLTPSYTHLLSMLQIADWPGACVGLEGYCCVRSYTRGLVQEAYMWMNHCCVVWRLWTLALLPRAGVGRYGGLQRHLKLPLRSEPSHLPAWG